MTFPPFDFWGLLKSNGKGGDRQRGRKCNIIAAIMGLFLSGLKANAGIEQSKKPDK
jgi:hypothetical protein